MKFNNCSRNGTRFASYVTVGATVCSSFNFGDIQSLEVNENMGVYSKTIV